MIKNHSCFSTISRENSSIGFGLIKNVVIHLSAPSDVDNERERDSSDVHTKVILDHKGDVSFHIQTSELEHSQIRFLRGPILTSNGPLVGFRSIHDSVGESMNLINIQTKQRHRFKVSSSQMLSQIYFFPGFPIPHRGPGLCPTQTILRSSQCRL